MTKRLEILQKSLSKKEQLLDNKFQDHFATVKQVNGQPLNDKRNGQATLNKWERQSDAIRNMQNSLEKTKQAIEREQSKIAGVEGVKNLLPSEILKLIENGELIQWRKHPTTFFVNGVDKARIVWDEKKKIVAHKYSSQLIDKDQRSKFAKIYNQLNASINK